ncbi:hypothetical protein ACODT5_26535 [Streptomyces sp. 5.8]|uniref:hypothetical protein n=1 Tax=Streptomyces sp. 5.8 TaxID=3406571 RepID=UPI003BB6D4DC
MNTLTRTITALALAGAAVALVTPAHADESVNPFELTSATEDAHKLIDDESKNVSFDMTGNHVCYGVIGCFAR